MCIIYVVTNWWRVGPGREPGFDKPQAKVLENLRDDLLILYKADDAHRALAFGTGEGVDFVDFLDKPGPILSKRFSGNIRVYKRRHLVVSSSLFPHTEGIVLEKWGHKIYLVVQEPVYQNLLGRYSLRTMTYNKAHSTVFAIYDLKDKRGKYELYRTRIESSTMDNLFKAFRNTPNIPAKDVFVAKLEDKIKAKIHLKLRLQ